MKSGEKFKRENVRLNLAHIVN